MVSRVKLTNSVFGQSILEVAHEQVGQDYFDRRNTNIPNFKNYRALRQIKDINKHYKIGKELGSGSFGVVNLANKVGSSEKVAIKTIKKRSLSDNPLLPQMMLSELLVLKSCDHPNIMKVIEILEDTTAIYIACEFMEGGELFEKILEVK